MFSDDNEILQLCCVYLPLTIVVLMAAYLLIRAIRMKWSDSRLKKRLGARIHD